MPKVTGRQNEPFERILRRFKRTVDDAGYLDDARKHDFFEKPSSKRKRAKAAAVKRAQRLQESQSVHLQKRLY